MRKRKFQIQSNLVKGFTEKINNGRIRKIFAVFLILTGTMGLSGCLRQQKRKEPNEGRGTDYAYDFVDFINITTYGDNGDGYIEITQKYIDVYDFANEKDYSAVKKDLEAM